jgi:hypothetical protein
MWLGTSVVASGLVSIHVGEWQLVGLGRSLGGRASQGGLYPGIGCISRKSRCATAAANGMW